MSPKEKGPQRGPLGSSYTFSIEIELQLAKQDYQPTDASPSMTFTKVVPPPADLSV